MKQMSVGYRIILAILIWVIFISGLHTWRNGKLFAAHVLKVGFLPITCHLLCPVTYELNKDIPFKPVKFTAWPEMCEALKSSELDMAFILAPLAITLYQQGFPIKLVMLGHRNGTGLMVRADAPHAAGIDWLEHKTIAIPIRFSNQYLTLLDLLEQAGIPARSVNLVEMPPPDMPSSLAMGAVDAYIVGEPYAAAGEMNGSGRILYLMKDVRPGFISSVLVVRADVLQKRKDEVVRLVRAFYANGAWIDGHRREAAAIGARFYGLPVALLEHVLLSQPDRVLYDDLLPKKQEIDAMAAAMTKRGLLKGVFDVNGFLDTSLVTEKKQ
ncbi:MAG: ABC transporter substrate-binding protein [Dissulfuribacterales bacterium]